LEVAGNGVLSLSNVNTYSGLTTIDSGATLGLAAQQGNCGNVGNCKPSADGEISASSGVMIKGAGTLDIAGLQGLSFPFAATATTIASIADDSSGNGSVVLGSNTLTVGDNRNLNSSFSGVISDCGSGGCGFGVVAVTGGALVKAGTGTLTLSGANTYSGGTTVNAGTLVVGNSSALGTGNLALAAGTTLSFAGGTSFNVGNTVTIAGDPTITTTPGSPQTLSGTITDATGPTPGALVVNGGGSLTLSGQNTYSLGTTISASGTTVVVTNSNPGTSSSIVCPSAIRLPSTRPAAQSTRTAIR
jgi:autotransporter-associated beta strand protein